MSNSLFSHFKLVDASTLKKEVAEGVDLMVVRELTGGQCSLISLGVIALLKVIYLYIFCFYQCFQNRTGDRIGKVTGSWFTGRTSGPTAVEPVT